MAGEVEFVRVSLGLPQVRESLAGFSTGLTDEVILISSCLPDTCPGKVIVLNDSRMSLNKSTVTVSETLRRY